MKEALISVLLIFLFLWTFNYLYKAESAIGTDPKEDVYVLKPKVLEVDYSKRPAEGEPSREPYIILLDTSETAAISVSKDHPKK